MRRKIAQLIRGIMGRDVRTHSSSISFFFFMALIPLLILLASVVPFFGISVSNVISFFHEIFPEDSSNVVDSIIREAFDHSGAAFSISVIMLLWTASRGVLALTEGLNAMYEEEGSRKFARVTLLSFAYTLALMAFMVSVIYLIFSGRLRMILRTFLPGVHLQSGMIIFLEFQVLLVIGTLFFCTVYRFLPSGKRSFVRQFPGAFIASTGWVIFSMLFRVYVDMFNSFTRFYGSLATVIVLLFWFYWIFFILLLGGYVNAHLQELLPGRFLDLFNQKRALSLVITLLFLLGFLAYLFDCYLNWRLYSLSYIRYFTVLFRVTAMASWMGATFLCAREMQLSYPTRYLVPLILFVIGDFVLMRRSLIGNVYVFLLVFSIWNLVILLLCMQVIFSDSK